jgi:hypothetical protein
MYGQSDAQVRIIELTADVSPLAQTVVPEVGPTPQGLLVPFSALSRWGQSTFDLDVYFWDNFNEGVVGRWCIN